MCHSSKSNIWRYCICRNQVVKIEQELEKIDIDGCPIGIFESTLDEEFSPDLNKIPSKIMMVRRSISHLQLI